MNLTDLLPGGALLDIGKTIIDRVVPDKNQAELAKQELEKAQQSGELQLALGQLEVNANEAKSTNWFVAGARPFILWICGFALAYASILEPIGRFVAEVGFSYKGIFPIIDTNITLQVLMGLLGLSGLRTYEKRTGTESNR